MKQKSFLSRLLPVAVLFVCSLGAISAQVKEVSGVVTDGTGEAVIGASVMVKGTTAGTITDFDGKYILSVPDGGNTLVFSYVGMQTKEVAITGSVVNVALEDDAQILDDVVVTGYGTTKKRDLVTSVASVNAEQLKDIPVTTAAEALQGKLAGVSVTTTEGSPDAEIKIRVRGGTSLTQSNDPLYIVDGFPVSSINDIAPSDIASMDVLKDAAATAIYGAQGANGVIIITTKESSADGEKSKITVDYTGYVGWKRLAKKFDVMDGRDFTLMQYEYAYLSAKNKGVMKDVQSNFNAYFDKLYNETKYNSEEDIQTTPIATLLNEYSDTGLYGVTDWQDEAFGRTGFNSNHSISVSGGSKSANFNLSYNRIDDKAIMEMSNYVRNNLSFKVKFNPIKNMTIGATARYTNTNVLGSGANALDDAGSKTESRLRNCVVYTPVQLLAKADAGDDADETFGSLYDPLTTIRDNYKYKEDNKWTLNGYASYKFAKHFTIKTEVGYEDRLVSTDRYYGPTTYFARNTGRPNIEGRTAQVQVLSESSSKLRNANTFEYKQRFADDHNFSLLVGEETIVNKGELKTLNGFGYKGNYNIEEGEIFNYLGQASYSEISNYINPADNMLSFFGRANYDFLGRYYLTATFRADASTRFEKENQWGFFPSAAAAWRMSDEPWMAGVSNWISNLKWRFSYGMAGNNNVDLGYLHSDFLSQQMTYMDMGSGVSNILVVGGSDKIAPNPHLKWETTVTRDLGVDYGFFNERLSGSIDIYWNNTHDLIVLQKLPARYNSQYQNIGSTENKGVEFSIKGIILDKNTKKLSYGLSIDANISMNRNKVVSLGNSTMISAQTGCFGSTEYKTLAEFIVEPGQPIGNIYGFELDGAGYYTAEDFSVYSVNAKNGKDTWGLKEGVVKYDTDAGDSGWWGTPIRPGSIKFKNQNDDEVINDKDKVLLGNTLPKFSGGFSINAHVGGEAWGSIDMNANFTYSYGNKILNLNKMEYTTVTDKSKMRNLISDANWSNRYSLFNEEGSYLPESYATGSLMTGEAYTAMAQQLDEANALKGASTYSPVMSHYVVTDRMVEDGSYLRLSSLTIGYSLPDKWINKAYIQKARIFVTGSNLFCLTKYSGLDPEVDTRSSKNPLTPGVDFSAYPKSRGINVGVNLSF